MNIQISKRNAENLERILSEVMLLDTQLPEKRIQMLERLIIRSHEANDILEELAAQDETFRYWP